MYILETQWALKSFQEESSLNEESEFSFGIEGYIFTLQRNWNHDF